MWSRAFLEVGRVVGGYAGEGWVGGGGCGVAAGVGGAAPRCRDQVGRSCHRDGVGRGGGRRDEVRRSGTGVGRAGGTGASARSALPPRWRARHGTAGTTSGTAAVEAARDTAAPGR
ncbi:hypothetical protein GCM10020295_68290 [Streptomyces cinereospinus]